MRKLWAAGAAMLVCLALGAPVMAQDASPSATPDGVQGPVQVTGTLNTVHGGHATECVFPFCKFDSTIVASDDRLTGNYELTPTGSTTAGTWGTIMVCEAFYCIPGTDPGGDPSWEGQWFTAGDRAVEAWQVDYDALYPVDTIWLNGLAENEGLSAVLRMEDPSHVEGWIFPTP